MQTIGEPSITCSAILRSWQKITYLPLDTQQWVQHAPLPLDCFDFESPPLNGRAIIIHYHQINNNNNNYNKTDDAIFNWVSKVSHYITLLHNAIGPRNSCHLRNQSDSNLTPIAPWLLEFSRALSGLLVAILSLVVMFSSALITLLFISRPLIEMLSKVLNLLPRDIQSKRCLQLITDLTAIPIKD